MKKIYFKLSAFTLAEVLITLSIIGIVAAMTLPALIQSYQEKVTVTKVKKMYSVMSQAVQLWQTEESCLDDVADCFGNESYNTACNNAMKMFGKHLKFIDMSMGNSGETENWLPEISYGLNGTAVTAAWQGVNALNGGMVCRALLNDGTTMSFSIPDDYKRSAFMFFDTNGAKKPNRVGIDIFPLGIGSYNASSKSVNPYYTEDNSNADSARGLCQHRNGNNCSADDGKSPTAYVLMHDKLPDLEAMGYPKN